MDLAHQIEFEPTTFRLTAELQDRHRTHKQGEAGAEDPRFAINVESHFRIRALRIGVITGTR
jgi:hypothetical protein